MLVSFNDVSFGYDDNLILKNMSFAINEGERIGLIGGNGEGKTTLLKLLLGKLYFTQGVINIKNGISIGYLEQDGGYDSANTVYGEMREVYREQFEAIERLENLSKQLSLLVEGTSEYKTVAGKIEATHKYISANDCYNAEVRIKRILNGMGFEDMYNQNISSMSGGEKTRFKLARILLEAPDLIILDEPTNHLDMKTLFWLEDYLLSFKGAIFVVSHDRYFLDAIISKIFEIENRKVTSFSGNYTKYKLLKAQKYEYELKEYERQQEEIAKLQDYVDRNIVRATTAKSAQSRVKQLEKMELLEKPYTPPRPPRFSFTYEISPYENVLTVKNIRLEIEKKVLLDNANFAMRRGEKIAIVGENGTGKSTLLKAIFEGNDAISLGRFVRFAYYDQENLNLNTQNSVLAEMWNRHVGFTQTEVRSALARCGLSEEDIDKSVGSLSGGERAKLALCVLESERGNFLLLDEPTNHLDLPAREALEGAIKAFDGSALIVSHDRYFMEAVASAILEIEDKKLTLYSGGYLGYALQKQALAKRQQEEECERATIKYEEERATKYRSRQDRAQEAKRRERIKAIEAEISRIESEEEDINRMLADPKITADFNRLNELCKRLEELKIIQEKLYEEYEKLI